MRIGSLFSGYGGLDLAALQLFPGSSVAWHCEWDKAPSKILAHHWPEVPNLHDVTAVDWAAVEPIDVLTGGYPCQPFSAAGRRKGTDDERHLWPYVRQAIRDLRPRFALLENVAGHRSMGFDRVLGDCAEDGLHVRWTSLRAADVGACHQRERIFIMVVTDADDAARHRERPCAELRQGDSHATDAEGDGRHEGRAESTRLVGRPHAALGGNEAVALLPTPSVADGTGGHLTRFGDRSNELLLPGVARAYGEGRLLPTPEAKLAHAGPDFARMNREGSGGHDLATAIAIAIESAWGDYAPAIQRLESVTRPAPSPTEPNSKGNPRLSAAFAEWMMMLPSGHVTDPAIGIRRNEQLKAIGNGVVPPQAFAAFSWLLGLEVAS